MTKTNPRRVFVCRSQSAHRDCCSIDDDENTSFCASCGAQGDRPLGRVYFGRLDGIKYGVSVLELSAIMSHSEDSALRLRCLFYLRAQQGRIEPPPPGAWADVGHHMRSRLPHQLAREKTAEGTTALCGADTTPRSH